MQTYPNMLSIHKELRHQNLVTLHPIPYLVLVLIAHEDVPFLILHQQVPQDLLHQHTSLVGASDYAHGCRVDHHFASVFFFVTL